MSELSRSPADLLKVSEALVLSVSDNHANVLLRTKKDARQGGPSSIIRSLLKMNVVPAHKEELAASKRFSSLDELNNAAIDVAESRRIIDFLDNLNFQLTSESGAEYSYYTAGEKLWWQNPLRFLRLFRSKDVFKVELISPASDRQIQRSMPSPEMSMVEETPEMFDKIVKPYIQTLIDGGSLSWIQNVVVGTKEAERLLLDTEDFILNVDTKWRSHPDAKTVPREEWYGHKSIEDLYCLAIVKDGSIASLRDLRGHHVAMLRAILELGNDTIKKVYGIPQDQVRVFVHYQPQFYHFHVHFTRLENEIGCQVERGHLLSDIIQNLEMDSEYYTKRTISYKLKTSSELYILLKKVK